MLEEELNEVKKMKGRKIFNKNKNEEGDEEEIYEQYLFSNKLNNNTRNTTKTNMGYFQTHY